MKKHPIPITGKGGFVVADNFHLSYDYEFIINYCIALISDFN